MMTETLQTYAEFRPTAFDHHISIDSGEDSREHWLIVPVSQTRDSGALETTNFAAALQSLGGESETVEVHRFGHWGPGWFEILIVNPADAERVRIAEDIARRLGDYPVLDESALSEAEYEDARQGWNDWGAGDLADALAKEFDVPRYSSIRDRLKDYLRTEDFWQTWMDECSVPYETHGDGPSFSYAIRQFTKECEREDFAELLTTVRHWERSQPAE